VRDPGRSSAQRREARQLKSAPVLEELGAWLRVTQRTMSVKSPLAAAIHYTLVRWTALTRYLDDGRVEIDTNAAERAIRALVLGRRNYLFAGSDAGGDTAACLYSLVGTCRLNKIDPHLYLRHVLARIATHPINRIRELLPWRVGPLLNLALSQAA
jgi:transposase